MSGNNIPKGDLIKFFAGYDTANGTDSTKIDTALEYKLLGDYLNGTSQYYWPEKYENLDKKDKNFLKKIYNSLSSKFKGNNSNLKVDEANAEKYVELYMCRSSEDNFDEEVKQALVKFLIENNYPEDIKTLSKEEIENLDLMFCIDQVMRKKRFLKKCEEKGEKVSNAINNPYDNTKLKTALDKYLETHDVQKSDKPLINPVNGIYDQTAEQQTEVCWAIAGYNALMTTAEGKSLIEHNSYFDEQSGTVAIHLQEAEDMGLPKGRGDGIYIVTQSELEGEGIKLAKGEGDITAYLIAIEKYFEEARSDDKVMEALKKDKRTVSSMDEGNAQFRFFEILTGAACSKYDSKYELTRGISYGNPMYIDFDKIYDTVANGSGVSTLSIAGHAISVVGVKDGKLLIQESNNLPDFDKEYSYHESEDDTRIIFKKEDDINNRYTYSLTKEDFYDFIERAAICKWN